jgi:hypothetical protein
MSKAPSLDLRTRVLAAIRDGLSCRQAALRFGVSASSAIRWRARELAQGLAQGDARPKALGGHWRSGRIAAHAGLIRELVEETPDITLVEIIAPSSNLRSPLHRAAEPLAHFADRTSLLEAQSASPRGRRAHRHGPLEHGSAVSSIPDECSNFFAAAGYVATWTKNALTL